MKEQTEKPRKSARRERKQYYDLLNEGVKPFKKWVMDDEQLKAHYELFNKWFKAYRDKGGQIGTATNTKRGVILLREKDWLFLKEAFLTDKRNRCPWCDFGKTR